MMIKKLYKTYSPMMMVMRGFGEERVHRGKTGERRIEAKDKEEKDEGEEDSIRRRSPGRAKKVFILIQ